MKGRLAAALLGVGFFISFGAEAKVFEATGSGQWQEARLWLAGCQAPRSLPGPEDTILVSPGQTVQVASLVKAHYIIIAPGAQLLVLEEGTLEVSGQIQAWGEMAIEGSLHLHGNAFVAGGGPFSLNNRSHLLLEDNNSLNTDHSTGALRVANAWLSPEASYTFIGTGSGKTGDAIPTQVACLTVIGYAEFQLKSRLTITERLSYINPQTTPEAANTTKATPSPKGTKN